MAAEAEIQSIKLETYDTYIGGDYIGLTKQGTFKVKINGKYTTVDDVDQIQGIVKEWETGYMIEIELTLKKADFDTIGGIVLRNRARLILDGAKKAYALGQQIKDLVSIAGEVLLHPASAPSLADRAGDMKFWKGALKAENLEIAGDRDNEQELALKISIYPDLSKPKHMLYGLLGDWTAQEVAPKMLFTSFDDKVQFIPMMHIPAVTLPRDGRAQLQVYAAYSNNSTITAAINFGGGYTATATSLVFDTLSASNAFSNKSYIKINGEYLYVKTVTYATATTGTLVVTRGVWGSVPASITDNDVITMQENYGIVRATDYVTFTGSDDTKGTVGDSAVATDDQKKGVLHNVANGSFDVEAETTVGVTTVTSERITVTTL